MVMVDEAGFNMDEDGSSCVILLGLLFTKGSRETTCTDKDVKFRLDLWQGHLDCVCLCQGLGSSVLTRIQSY
jgi:hypothetical protein